MTRFSTTMHSAAAIAIIAVATAPGLSAQQGPAPLPVKPIIAIKVDVVLSRYLADKKTSSLPFSLIVNANDFQSPQQQFNPRQTSVRMGVDVPIGTMTSTNGGVTTTKPDYRNIGTNIDCSATTLEDGRFKLSLSIQDSSVYGPDGETKSLRVTDPSAFRTFSTSNSLTMKEGQTTQLTVATDKVSGEVLKVDVTLALIK